MEKPREFEFVSREILWRKWKRKKNTGEKVPLFFQRPGKITFLGFEFYEGEEITSFVLDLFAFE